MSDLGPSTSYSDPFYDRLDAFAQEIKRRWWIVALVIVVTVIAVMATHQMMETRPEAGSAARYLAARSLTAGQGQDKVATAAALGKLMDDATNTPFFRARAAIDVLQSRLDAGDTAGAKVAGELAVAQANLAKDAELQLAATLSLAAAKHQGGDLDGALADYAKSERAAGAKYTVHQFEAIIGQARVLAAQGKKAEAIQALEPLQTRSDAGAEELLKIAKVSYWNLKREVAEAAAKPAAVAPAAAAAAAVDAAVTAATTATNAAVTSAVNAATAALPAAPAVPAVTIPPVPSPIPAK